MKILESGTNKNVVEGGELEWNQGGKRRKKMGKKLIKDEKRQKKVNVGKTRR